MAGTSCSRVTRATRWARACGPGSAACRLPCAAPGALRLPPPALYDRVATSLAALMADRHRPSRLGDRLHKAADLLALGSMDEVYRRLRSHWTLPTGIVPGSW